MHELKHKEQHDDRKASPLAHLVVGLLVGVLATIVITQAVSKPAQTTVSTNTGGTSMLNSDDAMDQMVEALRDKKGDDFDREFIRQMIPHHQSAVEMAQLIDSRAKHDEIKSLGKDIIQAQTDEINRMKSWYSDWGYGSYDTDTMGGMDHSMMH